MASNLNLPPLPEETPIPNAARIYDYTLGGTFNVEADRQAAEAMFQLVPSTRKWVTLLREFLQEVARELHADGFNQFLDLGSGLPLEDHIHAVVPDASVIYVDSDPLTVQYGQEIVRGTPNAYYLEGDLRQIEQILQSDTVKQVIDRSKKVAIGLNAVLVFFTWDEVRHIAQALHDWAPEGSLIYATFETKEIGKTTPRFAQFIESFAHAGMPMQIVSLEENIEMMKPWRFLRIEPVADYLGKPATYITDEDREGVGIEFYAALLGK